MRMACDESGTISELLDNILAATPFTPFLSLICGTECGGMARIEKSIKARPHAFGISHSFSWDFPLSF